MSKEVYVQDINPNLHPFDAWEFDNPSRDSTPTLTLKSPWLFAGQRATYHTGWINRSDWANVHMGSVTTKDTDSNVSHGLGKNIHNLQITVFYSSTGSWNGAHCLQPYTDVTGVNTRGICTMQVSTNAIMVHTGATGVSVIETDGTLIGLDGATEGYYFIDVTAIN